MDSEEKTPVNSPEKLDLDNRQFDLKKDPEYFKHEPTEENANEKSNKVLEVEPNYLDLEATNGPHVNDESSNEFGSLTEANKQVWHGKVGNIESEGESTTEEIDDEYSGNESDLDSGLDLPNDGQLILKWQNRNPNPQLPSTTTVLKSADGGLVYLVGTVHFSHESQEDVAKTILETQPDVVMVELCHSRVNILSMDEAKILEESKNMNLQKVRLAIKQNGLVQGMMYLLLLSMSAHLTKQLGMAPGGEFRRAYLETKSVPGCILQLGDRPIQITLQRALGALSWWQKLRLAWYIFTSKDPITKEEVERFKRSDLLEELLAEMTGEFPALSHVFVKERDFYLAYSLKLASAPLQTVNGMIPSVVVGVVGIGHVPGIVEHWEKVTEEDIAEVLKIPKPSLMSKIVRKSVKSAFLGVVVWGACRLLLPSSVYSALLPRRAYHLIEQSLPR